MGRSGGKLNCDLPMGKEMVLHSGFGADMVKIQHLSCRTMRIVLPVA